MPIQPAFQAFLLLLLLSTGYGTSSTAGNRLPLVERDNLSFSLDNDYPRRLEARMKRDARRVASLIRRLSAGDGSSTSAYKAEEYKMGTSLEAGVYAVTIGVGTPPQNQTLMIDTGSDLVWVQCQPCDKCYDQDDPVFDPNKSTSFSPVTCNSSDTSICLWLNEGSRGCDPDTDQCTYTYRYQGGSQTKGILATDSLTFGNTTVPIMPIGCGRKNEKFNIYESGILGLGRGSLSLVGGKLGGAFSYCLGETNGSLEIGRSSFPENATWVPMIFNTKNPGFYYIGLLGLGVGGEIVPVPDDIFQINPDTGDGGAIIDTGTTLTYLPKAAYEPLRDMFISKTANLTGAPKYSVLDTCFYSDSLIEWLPKVPDVSFFIYGGLTLNLTRANSLIRIAYDLVCFAFAPLSNSNLTIIGNIQQQGIRITINGLGYIGFGPDVCNAS